MIPDAERIKELKAAVLAIEWEITDEVMERFLSQVDSLRVRFGEDRILVMFLQLLGSLGLYVKTNKGKAHPNAFKLLNSVYTSFEDAASPGKISPSEKKKCLYNELNKYKELKGQIESLRGPENEPSKMPTTATQGNGQKVSANDLQQTSDAVKTMQSDSTLTQEHFDTVIDHLKTTILKELAGIRNDLAKLSKNR